MAVHVSPPSAVVFKRGQRFGTGRVTVNVVRGTKMTLVARLDGYLPRTFVVDGRYNSVNIVLQPAQEAAIVSPAVADTPSDSARASDPEPIKRSPSPSTSTAGSDPISDVDPL